jgi:hypothetical protein
MNVLKKIGNAIWNFMVLVGEARVQRELMHRQALKNHQLGS